MLLSPKFYALFYHPKCLSNLASVTSPPHDSSQIFSPSSKYLQAQKCLLSNLPHLHSYLFHSSANQKEMSYGSSSYRQRGMQIIIQLEGGKGREKDELDPCIFFLVLHSPRENESISFTRCPYPFLPRK